MLPAFLFLSTLALFVACGAILESTVVEPTATPTPTPKPIPTPTSSTPINAPKVAVEELEEITIDTMIALALMDAMSSTFREAGGSNLPEYCKEIEREWQPTLQEIIERFHTWSSKYPAPREEPTVQDFYHDGLLDVNRRLKAAIKLCNEALP